MLEWWHVWQRKMRPGKIKGSKDSPHFKTKRINGKNLFQRNENNC